MNGAGPDAVAKRALETHARTKRAPRVWGKSMGPDYPGAL